MVLQLVDQAGLLAKPHGEIEEPGGADRRGSFNSSRPPRSTTPNRHAIGAGHHDRPVTTTRPLRGADHGDNTNLKSLVGAAA
jgi:hypothetical protein